MVDAQIHLIMTSLRFSGWKLALAAGLLFLPFSVRALDPDKSLFQYNGQNWTSQNDLPQDRIFAITQTKDGFIWLGTSNGLIRYDGVDFTPMPIDLPGARSHAIRALSATKGGGFLIAIRGAGFGGFDGRNFFTVGDDHFTQKSMDPITVRQARDGAVWMAGDSGHGRWLKDKPAQSFFLGETNIGVVLSMCEDATGRIWLGTAGHGVYSWFDGKSSQISDQQLNDRNVLALATDTNGTLWVGTDQGLMCYDAQGDSEPISAVDAEVRALLVDRHGSVWVGTSGMGVVRYQKGDTTRLTKVDGLVSDNVTALFEDAEGSLWVGTPEGLSQLTDVKFPIYSDREGFTGGPVLSVSTDAHGGLLATTTTGATLFDGTVVTKYTDKSLFPNPYLNLGFQARNGDLYVVDGDKNLNIITNGQLFKRYACSDWPSALAEDAKSVLVPINSPPQLMRVLNGELQPFQFKGDAPQFYWINNLCVSRDGTIWVASKNGIFSIQPDGGYQQWQTAEGSSWLNAYWVSEDTDGSIWAGTGGGMARIKNGHVNTFSRASGLKDDEIHAIVPDDFGSLWLSAGRGIMRGSRQDLDNFAAGKTPRIQCELFDGSESVKATQRTDLPNSGCKTRDGRIWFPSSLGAIMIDPRHYFTNAVPPPVAIRKILVDDTELKDWSRPTLSSSAERVEFQFSALSFITPAKVKMRYQLVGLEPGWVDAGTSRSAVYNKLKTGKYTFRIQACNADGVWNTAGDSFAIILPPPYYETGWFRALSGMALLLVLFGVFQWKMRHMELEQRKLQEENEKLEARVLRRTSELAEANSSLRGEIDKREDLHRQLMEASRRAGMAEVATGVLHNVGNVLTSVNTSAGVLSERLRSSKVSGVVRVSEMLEQHRQDLGSFFTQEDRGPRLVDYVKMLSTRLVEDQSLVLRELNDLTRNIDHIKEIVSVQQNYAKAAGVTERLSVTELVEDALRMHTGALTRHAVRVVKQFEDVPEIEVDKHKVIQILINLVNNAKYALEQAPPGQKTLTVGVSRQGADRIRIIVRDNGMGVAPENLARIFAHGFTTRKDGHGFGLHSGALAAKDMGGALAVESAGLDKGATFTLELPLHPPERNAEDFSYKGELKSGDVVKGE